MPKQVPNCVLLIVDRADLIQLKKVVNLSLSFSLNPPNNV